MYVSRTFVDMKIRTVLVKVFPFLKNKYILSSLLFVILVIFFSQNNLLDRYDYIRELNQLQKDKEYYLEAIGKAEQKMHDLKTNKESLEKFAREEYLMKKPDEDIFIIVHED